LDQAVCCDEWGHLERNTHCSVGNGVDRRAIKRIIRDAGDQRNILADIDCRRLIVARFIRASYHHPQNERRHLQAREMRAGLREHLVADLRHAARI